MNLAQAGESPGVRFGKTADAEAEKCCEKAGLLFGKMAGVAEEECSETEPGTESEDESGSDGEAKSAKSGAKRASLGLRSPRTIPGMAVEHLVRSVYGELADEQPIIVHEDEVDAMGVIMTQLSLKQGLKQWGEKAEASAIKEMRQMHDMSAFFPRSFESLSKEERR